MRRVRAAVHQRCAPPSVLRIDEVPREEPGPDEILVEVICTSVNRTDDGFLRAKPFIVRLFGGLRRPRHVALGCEFAGRVAVVGSDVSRFAMNDRLADGDFVPVIDRTYRTRLSGSSRRSSTSRPDRRSAG